MVRATILASGSALAAALAVSVVYAGHGSSRGPVTPPYITKAVGDSARPEADTRRDADRHPALTLAFAGPTTALNRRVKYPPPGINSATWSPRLRPAKARVRASN